MKITSIKNKSFPSEGKSSRRTGISVIPEEPKAVICSTLLYFLHSFLLSHLTFKNTREVMLSHCSLVRFQVSFELGFCADFVSLY
jgi:ABC-type uncharacterized transport system permease subunit